MLRRSVPIATLPKSYGVNSRASTRVPISATNRTPNPRNRSIAAPVTARCRTSSTLRSSSWVEAAGAPLSDSPACAVRWTFTVAFSPSATPPAGSGDDGLLQLRRQTVPAFRGWFASSASRVAVSLRLATHQLCCRPGRSGNRFEISRQATPRLVHADRAELRTGPVAPVHGENRDAVLRRRGRTWATNERDETQGPRGGPASSSSCLVRCDRACLLHSSCGRAPLLQP